MNVFLQRLLQGPEIPERQLYKEPPEAFLEADNMEDVRIVVYLFITCHTRNFCLGRSQHSLRRALSPQKCSVISSCC